MPLIISTAFAQALPVDAEMVNTRFSAGAPPGMESPLVAGEGAQRGGFMVQYERDPVVLFNYGEEMGSVVRNRLHTTVGWSYDLNSRVALRGQIPVVIQQGTDYPALSWSGAGLGDMALGGRVMLAQAGPITVGGNGMLMLPTGTNASWFAEDGVRYDLGLAFMGAVGPARIVLDGRYLHHNLLATGKDYVLEPELSLNTGAMVDLWPGHLSGHVAFLAKGGSNHLFQGGGENASELIGGMTITTRDHSQVDFGLGKGIGPGVGTTAFRAYVSYTKVVMPVKAPPEPEPVVFVEEPVKPPTDVEIEELVEPEPWKEEELARIEGEQIVIREPIQFEFATDTILPESIDTLEAVAKIMNEHAEIAHVVIEGHASEEGSFEYNTDLSNMRAGAVWKELMRVGVHPDRISYRGMGEVEPVNLGTDEASLAQNRRVEFHIVSRVPPEGPYPVYPETYKLPWNGEVMQTVQPAQPQAPTPIPVNPEDPVNPDQFKVEEQEEAK